MAIAIGSAGTNFKLPGYAPLGVSPFDYDFSSTALLGKQVLLSFISISKSSDGSASVDFELVNAIKGLASSYSNIVNVVVIGNPLLVEDPDVPGSTAVTDAWIKKNLPSGFTYNPSTMPILRIVSTGGSYTDPTADYIGALGAGTTWPGIFALRSDFIVVDAFHLVSSDSGSSMTPSSGWSAKDYVQFNWTEFSPTVTTDSDKLAKFSLYLSKRIEDLQAPTARVTITAPSSGYVAEGSTVDFALSGIKSDGSTVVVSQGRGSRDAAVYTIDTHPRFSSISVATDIQYKLTDYLAGTKELRTAVLGDMTADHPQNSRPVSSLALGVTSGLIDANDTGFAAVSPPTVKLLRTGAALYPRSNTSDEGRTPKAGSTGSLFDAVDLVTMNNSLDANAAQTLAANPNANPSNTRDILTNTQYYAYMRVKNAGSADIAPTDANVKGILYYFPSSTGAPVTLTKLGDFNFTGLTSVTSIRANFQNLVVTAALPFKINDAIRHYCYVCSVGTSDFPLVDPKAALDGTQTCEQWHSFLVNNFNTAWRNFNIVGVGGSGGGSGAGGGASHPIPGAPKLPDQRKGWQQIPFDFPGGFSKKDGPLQLVVAQNLPEKVELYTDLPRQIRGALKGRKGEAPLVKSEQGDLLRARLAPSDRERFVPIKLKPRVSNRVWLNIFFPDGLNGSWDLSASSFYEGVEIGRVTWRFVVRPFLYGKKLDDSDFVRK
jgi:hypothetical protein